MMDTSSAPGQRPRVGMEDEEDLKSSGAQAPSRFESGRGYHHQHQHQDNYIDYATLLKWLGGEIKLYSRKEVVAVVLKNVGLPNDGTYIVSEAPDYKESNSLLGPRGALITRAKK